MSGLKLELVDAIAIERATKRRHQPKPPPPDESQEARQRRRSEAEDDEAVDDAAAYFMQSYRGMRFTIGAVAFLLPWVLILVDWVLLEDTRRIRGSMSAYYHSSARDIFVGGLIATGGFLVSYMRGKRRTYDFWLSSVAGVLIIVVALFPTGREPGLGFRATKDSCTTFAGPPPCTSLQRTLGEDKVMLIHGICASLFVLMLLSLCAVFALREFGYGPAADKLCGRTRDVSAVLKELKRRKVNPLVYVLRGAPGVVWGPDESKAPRRRTLLYIAMLVVMLLAVLWKLVGTELTVPGTSLKVAPLYLTEFVSFNAFGVAWLAASSDLQVFEKVKQRVHIPKRQKGATSTISDQEAPAPQSAG